MANVKITQLPSATTPLTGTEVFPLVQGTTTKQVAITGLFTSPVMSNPTLGVVGQADLINATGLPIASGVSGLGTGIATFLGTPSSANLRTAVTDETGTGALVFANAPVLVAPDLGTPTFLVATNATGTAVGLTAGSAITNANLTGAVTSVGNATSLGSFTSAQLRTALTDETGAGVAVFATSPTITAPILNQINDTNNAQILGLSPTTSAVDYLVVKNGTGVGVPLHFYADGSSANIGLHIQPKGTGLVTISDGTDFNKGIRFRSSSSAASAVTLLDAVSTAGRVVTLPDATTTLVGRDTTDTLTNKTINLTSNTLVATSAQILAAVTDETGTGSLVFATSPTLVTPILGTPTSATLTNATGLPISTGVSGLGTGIATALAVNTGSAGAPVLFNGALGTPSSGTVTNLTGTASININGTVGATTPTTGAFTTIRSSTGASSAIFGGGSTSNEVVTITAQAGGLGIGLGIQNSSSNLSGISFPTYANAAASYTYITADGRSGASGFIKSYVNDLAVSTLTSTGLGIGTTSPTQKLQVAGNVAIADGGWFGFGDVNERIVGNNAGYLQFFTDGTESMRLTSTSLYTASGINVGIGTSSPALAGYNRELTVSAGTSGTARAGINIQGSRTTDSTFGALTFFHQANNVGSIEMIRGGADNSGAMQFFTANSGTIAERGRFTSGGYFKASNAGTYQGSTDSYHELRSSTIDNEVVYISHTNATNPIGVTVKYTAASPNGTGNSFIYCADSTAVRVDLRSNGGIANYAANNVILSDRREKTNFAPATSYLDKICAIPVQTFNYIDQDLINDGGLTLGVVAQDVQAVAPELVTEGNWGTEETPKMRLEIYQTDLQYALMKALQELKADFDAYKASHP